MDKLEKANNEVAELQNNSPHSLISQALAQGLGIDVLERLMDLQERWEKNQAKKAFDEAMSIFQSKCPIIKKTKNGAKTKSGTVAYKYAPIENIVSQTKNLIAQCGFSYLIKAPSFTNDSVEISVEVRHNQGHSETSTIKMPLVSKTDVMSAPQVVASTVTFAKRYAFCDAFGIMTMDSDNDAKPMEEQKQIEKIPEPKQKEVIPFDWTDTIKSCKTTKELKALWERLSEQEQATFKKTFEDVKGFIEDAKKKEK